MSTPCRIWSTPRPAAFTRPSIIRWPPPAVSPWPTPTCRTSPSAPPRAGASARPPPPPPRPPRAPPNLQTTPTRPAEGRRIREAFVAEPGHLLLSADYSQIELRILAHLSQDKTLIETFRRGEDIPDR